MKLTRQQMRNNHVLDMEHLSSLISTRVRRTRSMWAPNDEYSGAQYFAKSTIIVLRLLTLVEF